MKETKEDNILTTPVVAAAEEGRRLDKYLSDCFPEMSRSRLQKLITEGNVSADEVVVVDNARKIKAGDSFQVFVPEAEDAVPQAEDIPLDVVYEDNDLLVVNKPAGMTVHPAPGSRSGTLVNALLFHCRNSLSGIGGVRRPGIVHRIDKDTSGLLVVAKNDKAHGCLCEQFAEHSVERTYYAVVYGIPNPLSGRIEGNIGRSPYDRKKMAVLKNGGRFAATNYKTQEVFQMTAALVQCRLETGRTHQIRVHMSSIGCPLIGDKVYEKAHKSTHPATPEVRKYINSFPRQALHAATLGFIHPSTGKFLKFETDFPEDMVGLLSVLRGV